MKPQAFRRPGGRHRAGAGDRDRHLRRAEPLGAGQGVGRAPVPGPRRAGGPDRQDRAQAGRQGPGAGARQGELVAGRPRRLSGQDRGGARRCWSSSPRPSWSSARRATRTAMPCSSWRTRRPRTPSRACVRLLDDKGGVIAEAIVGKKRFDAFGASKSGTYVRKPGDAQTWLSNADIDVSRRACATGCSPACSTCPRPRSPR